MTNEDGVYDDSGVAVVCEHIGAQSSPILLALRTEPLEPEDSGWQFLCNLENQEDPKLAKVWSIKSVIKYDPTLAGHLEQPSGTRLIRESINSEWKVVKAD